MKQGSLSDHFVGVGAKRLKGTEVDPGVSRGHELQGISDFRAFLGSPAESVKLPVSYVWLSDDEPPQRLDLAGTWYDSRRGQAHRDPEYRLYYPAAAEEIVYRARAGDTLFLCQPREGPLLALFCGQGTSIEQQLLWLFGLELIAAGMINQKDLRGGPDLTLDFTARYVLELIGIETLVTEDEWLERMLRRFGDAFPPTAEFSEFARKAITDVDPIGDPDDALLQWIEFEERLFMTLERHIVSQRLEKGFFLDGRADVDAFVAYSLSVHNRRKSRAGYALTNHIEAILSSNGIRFTREATTEKRNGPDFLFPGEAEYRDPRWPVERLSMLGAKTSCKDRWRQVLSEADRIEQKHLLTLEPSISQAQTAEMQRANLQLVLPQKIHESYCAEQHSYLINMVEFINLIRNRQKN